MFSHCILCGGAGFIFFALAVDFFPFACLFISQWLTYMIVSPLPVPVLVLVPLRVVSFSLSLSLVIFRKPRASASCMVSPLHLLFVLPMRRSQPPCILELLYAYFDLTH